MHPQRLLKHSLQIRHRLRFLKGDGVRNLLRPSHLIDLTPQLRERARIPTEMIQHCAQADSRGIRARPDVRTAGHENVVHSHFRRIFRVESEELGEEVFPLLGVLFFDGGIRVETIGDLVLSEYGDVPKTWVFGGDSLDDAGEEGVQEGVDAHVGEVEEVHVYCRHDSADVVAGFEEAEAFR